MDNIQKHKLSILDNISKSFVQSSEQDSISGEFYTELSIKSYVKDLNKAFNNNEITLEEFEKGKKDLSKLAMKQIIDSKGHKRIVYVKIHKDDKGEEKETDYDKGQTVKFSKDGKEYVGVIHSLKFHEKTDKTGTAIVDVDGKKYSVSLVKLHHHETDKDDESYKKDVEKDEQVEKDKVIDNDQESYKDSASFNGDLELKKRMQTKLSQDRVNKRKREIEKHKQAMDDGATEVEADQIARGKRNVGDHSGKKEKSKILQVKNYKVGEKIKFKFNDKFLNGKIVDLIKEDNVAVVELTKNITYVDENHKKKHQGNYNYLDHMSNVSVNIIEIDEDDPIFNFKNLKKSDDSIKENVGKGTTEKNDSEKLKELDEKEDNRKVLQASTTNNKKSLPSNIQEYLKGSGSHIKQEANKVNGWLHSLIGRNFSGGTAIGKYYGTLVLDVTHQGSEVYINEDGTIKVNNILVNSKKEFENALKKKFKLPSELKKSFEDNDIQKALNKLGSF